MPINKDREDFRFYRIWGDMKNRCSSPNNAKYHRYGGRGIMVCDTWLKYEGFKNDMYSDYLNHVEEFGEKQTTLDRINRDDNYSKQNCRWATYSEQNSNTSRNIKFKAINLEGKEFIIERETILFCELNNLKRQRVYDCLKGRLKSHNGWTFIIHN